MHAGRGGVTCWAAESGNCLSDLFKYVRSNVLSIFGIVYRIDVNVYDFSICVPLKLCRFHEIAIQVPALCRACLPKLLHKCQPCIVPPCRRDFAPVHILHADRGGVT